MGGNEGERGRQGLQDQIMQMLESDPSLANAAKTALTPGQSAAAAGSDYRRPSRFADSSPPAREMPDKRPRGFHDAPAPLLPSGPTDNRSSFQGYGQAPNSAALAQSGVGDFRGLHDKMQALYPGSQPSSAAESETHPTPTPSFPQPPPGGMSTYARPPPASVPQAGFGMSGSHWAGTSAQGAANGRKDWRPGFGRSSGPVPDYHNPMQQQQRLAGNWQSDGMPYSRFQ